MSRHVSAETLSMFRADGVSERKAARIRAHLSTCQRCASANSELASLSNLLAGVPAPTMPAHLADRITLALANESAARASAATGSATTGAAVPGRPDLPERSSRRSWQLRIPRLSAPLLLGTVAATAAVVVIAGAGFLLAAGDSATSTAGGSNPAAEPRAAAPGAMTPVYEGLVAPVGVRYHRAGKIANTLVFATNTDYSRRFFGTQVRKVTASRLTFGASTMPVVAPTPQQTTTSGPTMTPGPTTRPTAPSSLPGNADGANHVGIAGITVPQLEGCLTRIASGRKVLLADVARYLGQPAVIIVLKPAKAAEVLDVTVVGLACSASASDVITHAKVPAG